MARMLRMSDGRRAANEVLVVGSEAILYWMKYHATGDSMIDEWIVEAIRTNVVSANRIPSSRVETLLAVIENQFTGTDDREHPLWERFSNDVSRRRMDGWSLICNYASHKPILLYCEHNQFAAYQFMSGEDLRTVLNDCPGFEFYVTNEDLDYVLCHNHHDYIIGVGACQPWLSTLSEE
jgi:hypothetical protein